MIKKSYQYLQFELEQAIGILTINREDKLNALNSDLIEELRSFLQEISDKPLSGMILTGAGEKSFIAGADIAAMTEMSPKQAQDFAFCGQHVTLMIEELRFPVVAAVNGFSLGGGLEMALACDYIYATQNALFGLPEVSLGLIPGFGGTQRLSKIIGRHRAKQLIYSGRKIKIDEAKRIGLVLEDFESKDQMLKQIKNELSKLQHNSPHAIGVAKTVINKGADLSVEEGLEIEKSQFAQLFDSYDMQEGTKAFIEKRKAEFKGK